MSSALYGNLPPPIPPRTYNGQQPQSIYEDINNAVVRTPRYFPMPLPRKSNDIILNTSLIEGGRRLRRRKSTRRHCKTKYRRRQNKKKSKKRT